MRIEETRAYRSGTNLSAFSPQSFLFKCIEMTSTQTAVPSSRGIPPRVVSFAAARFKALNGRRIIRID
jgi:hypothetical protein